MRLTRLDECCAPLAAGTTCAMIVTDGFVSVQYSPEISEAEDIELKNAAGEICVTDPGCDELKWFNLQLNFCQVDPDIFSFITNSPLVLDHAGVSVGNRIRSGSVCGTNFALEVWTDIPQEQCTTGPNAAKPYGYFLVPCISSGIVGEFTIENDALTMQINAKSRAGSGWGVGPYDVDPTAVAGVAGPLLTPIGPDDQMDIHMTTVAPPPAVCGCQPMPA